MAETGNYAISRVNIIPSTTNPIGPCIPGYQTILTNRHGINPADAASVQLTCTYTARDLQSTNRPNMSRHVCASDAVRGHRELVDGILYSVRGGSLAAEVMVIRGCEGPGFSFISWQLPKPGDRDP